MNSFTKLRLMSQPQRRYGRDFTKIIPLPADGQPLFQRRDTKSTTTPSRIRQLIEAQERP